MYIILRCLRSFTYSSVLCFRYVDIRLHVRLRSFTFALTFVYIYARLLSFMFTVAFVYVYVRICLRLSSRSFTCTCTFVFLRLHDVFLCNSLYHVWFVDAICLRVYALVQAVDIADT